MAEKARTAEAASVVTVLIMSDSPVGRMMRPEMRPGQRASTEIPDA
jgi:hypothetical protein